jgi:transcriptional regulator with XRE-family HTH domain
VPTRAAIRGRALGQRLVQRLSTEIDNAARDRGLSYASIGRATGLSGQQVGRICRGEAGEVSLVRLTELATVVGLDLAARTYSGGTPLRDRAHAALLERLRARLPVSLHWRTEVPIVQMPGAPDQRAWDAMISGPSWLVGVEAETRVADLQALERRLALKRRDGAVDAVILLLNDTRHHRILLDSVPALAGFAMPARAALRALGRGERPSGDAVVRL